MIFHISNRCRNLFIFVTLYKVHPLSKNLKLSQLRVFIFNYYQKYITYAQINFHVKPKFFYSNFRLTKLGSPPS